MGNGLLYKCIYRFLLNIYYFLTNLNWNNINRNFDEQYNEFRELTTQDILYVVGSLDRLNPFHIKLLSFDFFKRFSPGLLKYIFNEEG